MAENKDKEKEKDLKDEKGKDSPGAPRDSGSGGGKDKIIDAAAKISTLVRTGRAFATDLGIRTNPEDAITAGKISAGSGYVKSHFAVVGISQFDFAPTLGVACQASDDVNFAFKALYSFIRHANSGARNYQSPDLAGYVLATDSVYGLYLMGCRALAAYDHYLPHNLYTPEALVRAMGFDWDDLIEHIPDLRVKLALYRKSLIKFKVPASLEYLKAHWILNNNVFMDGEIEKSQWYVFTQKYFFKYAPTDGKVDLDVKMRPDWMTVEQYLNLLKELIDALATSDDYDMISGDVEKAFGAAGTFELPELDSYTLTFTKSIEMLEAINNMLITPLKKVSSLISTDTGHNYFKCEPICTSECGVYGYLDFANFVDADPDPMRVYDALRFHPSLDWRDSSGSTGPSTYVIRCGTELITGWRAYLYGYSSNDELNQLAYREFGSNFVTIAESMDDTPWDATTATRLCAVGAITSFDYHPIIVPVLKFQVGNVACHPIVDLQNVAPLKGAAAVDLVHEARIYNNFFNF